MKIKKQILIMFIFPVLLLTLTGCGGEKSTQMMNEISLPLDGIKEIAISYDDENITFKKSDRDDLIIKEYMSKDKKNYHANVSQKSDSIHISEGGKPLFKDSFIRYIEVYLPNSYTQNLNVMTTNGEINMTDVVLELNSIRIDSTSGTIRLNKADATNIHLTSTSGKLEIESVIADQIQISTTQGDVICNKIEGNIIYTSTSGNADFKSCVGSGIYKANNSGKLLVNYTEVLGNLSLYNKNDNIELSIPSTLNFNFEATTKNGSISTDFKEDIKVNKNEIIGTVGNNPNVNIQVETKNGDIQVTR